MPDTWLWTRRSKGTISEECVVGYLLRTGTAMIGAHGIPADAGCFPNWVRRDLEKGGVNGFEGTAMPIRWKGTTVRTLDGNTVRIHEIAGVGKPIFKANRPGSSCHVVQVNTTLRLFLGPEGTLRRMARFERRKLGPLGLL